VTVDLVSGVYNIEIIAVQLNSEHDSVVKYFCC